MKVLLLGDQGNLGSQFKLLLSNEPGISLFGLDKNDLDVLQFTKLEKYLNEVKPEIIINTIAYNAVDKCEEESGFVIAKKINGELVGVLANWALVNQAILVHYSTDYVFSGDQLSGYDEAQKPNPINNYGRSKLMGEEAVLKCIGLKYYLIRTSKLFGPVGSSPTAKPSFFDIMLNLATDAQEIKAVDSELSCFTYTPDLAQASWGLVKTGQPSGIYHLVNSNPVTWYQAAQSLFAIKNLSVNCRAISANDMPRPAQRPPYSVLLNTKTKALRNYEVALAEYLLIK